MFANKAQFKAGFSEILKLKDDAVLTILDVTIMLQDKCDYIFCYMFTSPLSVKQIIWYEYLCIVYLNYCKRPSVKDVDCQTCTTVSLQSVTAIQRSVPKGGGGGVKTGQKIAYYFSIMFFL